MVILKSNSVVGTRRSSTKQVVAVKASSFSEENQNKHSLTSANRKAVVAAPDAVGILQTLDTATERNLKHYFDLVWYAKNRMRHYTHKAVKRIEANVEYKEDLEKLAGPNPDYYHGYHSGCMASARLFHAQTSSECLNEVLSVEECTKESSARNSVLAKEAVEQTLVLLAQVSKKYDDLVWYALNRMRYPCSERIQTIENTPCYEEDLKHLEGPFASFYHGLNTGIQESLQAYRDILEPKQVANGEAQLVRRNSFSLAEQRELDLKATKRILKQYEEKTAIAKFLFPNTNISTDEFP